MTGNVTGITDIHDCLCFDSWWSYVMSIYGDLLYCCHYFLNIYNNKKFYKIKFTLKVCVEGFKERSKRLPPQREIFHCIIFKTLMKFDYNNITVLKIEKNYIIKLQSLKEKVKNNVVDHISFLLKTLLI